MSSTASSDPSDRRATREAAPRRAPRTAADPRRWVATRPIAIAGLGGYVPEHVLDNAELERRVETSDDWIRTRTGIRERRIAAVGQATSDLAAEAGREALARAELAPEALELIVLASATGDSPVPASACHVQRKLGAGSATAFDIGAGCTGFIMALMTAHGLLGTGAFGNALVIGAEVLSSITDYRARETCVLLGDGAGAMVLRANGSGARVLDHLTGCDGSLADLIQVRAGGSLRPASTETVERREHYLEMRGREVFRFAARMVPEVVRNLLARNGCGPQDVALFVPHQANLRILEAVAGELGVELSRFAINLDRLGNTSAASIPLALAEAQRSGRLSAGDRVVLVAFGAGMCWGATLLEW
ncbi:MAG TPA: beta-ketoacyl-ACP synthase III [Planctomycetota bacterium]|nr:beta-ketoacyl-ACP synthase III [Planctomycetota bacterium]